MSEKRQPSLLDSIPGQLQGKWRTAGFLSVGIVFAICIFLIEPTPKALPFAFAAFAFWAVGAFLDYLFRQTLQDSIANKISSEGELLRAQCTIINGIMQVPGMAQIRNNQLVLTPAIGKTISIPLEQIDLKREYGRYNGVAFGKQGAYFDLAKPGQWRFGFGVRDADPWRSYTNQE